MGSIKVNFPKERIQVLHSDCEGKTVTLLKICATFLGYADKNIFQPILRQSQHPHGNKNCACIGEKALL